MSDERAAARITELEADVARLRAEQTGRRLLDPAEVALLGALGEVPAFLILFGPDLKLRYINRVVPPLRLADVVGADLYDFVAPEDRDSVRQVVAQLRETGQPVRTTLRALGPHGEPAEYEALYAAVDEPDGRGVCVVSVDVTETRRRDRELRESEAKLRMAVGATGVGLWSWTAATGHTYLSELVHPDDRAALQESAVAALQGGAWRTMAHRIVRPDGSVRWVMARGQTLLDGGGAVERVVGGTVDVTDHRALEEQLRHVQRLDALGQLTAGIAHNFNNLLTVITSTLDLMKRRRPIALAARVDGVVAKPATEGDLISAISAVLR